jgi:Domain of unknown function (DUF4157)
MNVAMLDHERGGSRRADASERAPQESHPAPGRRTLTMSLPGRGRGSGAVEFSSRGNDADPRAADRQRAQREHTRQLLDAAVRPDLHELPMALDPEAPLQVPRLGAGAPLPEQVRRAMERSFHADFGSVRIHEDPHVAALGAEAYTRGADIAFAPGRYQPESAAGLELLGHELAHVVQQAQGRVRPTLQARGLPINDDEGLEREADTLGARAARGELVASGARTIARDGVVTQGVFKLKGNILTTTQVDRLAGALRSELTDSGLLEFRDAATRERALLLNVWLFNNGVKLSRETLAKIAGNKGPDLASSPQEPTRREDEEDEEADDEAPPVDDEAPPANDRRAWHVPSSGFLAERPVGSISPGGKRGVPRTRKVGERKSQPPNVKNFLAAWEAHIRQHFRDLTGELRTKEPVKRQEERDASRPEQRHLARLAWVINQMSSAERVCTAVVAFKSELLVYTNSGKHSKLQSHCDLLLLTVGKNQKAYLEILQAVARQTRLDHREKNPSQEDVGRLFAKAKRRVLKAILLLRELRAQSESFAIKAHKQKTKNKHCELRHADATVPRDRNKKPQPATSSEQPQRHAIGVSKLFCLKCGLGIKVLKEIYNIELVGLGHHMASYNTADGWTLPDFLRDNDQAMEAFLGKIAYDMFKTDKELYIKVIESNDLQGIKKYGTADIVSSAEEVDEAEVVGISTTARKTRNGISISPGENDTRGAKGKEKEEDDSGHDEKEIKEQGDEEQEEEGDRAIDAVDDIERPTSAVPRLARRRKVRGGASTSGSTRP